MGNVTAAIPNTVKTFEFAEKYVPYLSYDKQRKLFTGGRENGKTSHLCAAAYLSIADESQGTFDAVVCVATTDEIESGIGLKLMNFVREYDPYPSMWELNRVGRAYKLSRRDRRDKPNGIWLWGASDRSKYSGSSNRTRGAETRYPVRFFAVDEVQNFANGRQVNDAIVSFERNFHGKGYTVVISGNNEHGWLDDFEADYAKMGYIVEHPTCSDVWDKLPLATRETITRFYKYNYEEFRKIYLGDVDAYDSKVVFTKFDPKAHYISRDKFEAKLRLHYPVAVMFGADIAATRDALAVCPTFILSDATAVCAEQLYYSPRLHGRPIGTTEACAAMIAHYKFIVNKYNLYGAEKYYYADCANAGTVIDLYAMLNEVDNDYTYNLIANPFTFKQDKNENIAILNDCFAREILYVLDEGETVFNWVTRKRELNRHHLRSQMMAMRRNEQGKLVKSIENDAPDALEYSVVPWFKSPYRRRLPQNIHQYDIESLYGTGKKYFERRFN
jgi:hypothetical protein